MEILKVNNVSKKFGNKQVIKDLSFSIQQNSIYGFLGQNGAGKTTVMKMILGLHTIDDGEIYVNGKKVTFGQNKTNKDIGYLADVPSFYDFMTAYEYLKLCADIVAISDKEKRIVEMLELVGLKNDKTKISGYSRGMRQRLGIASALLAKPLLLICDEPTSALDPSGRIQILDILKTASQDTTIIFSTHILTDVQRICDHIGILHNSTLQIDSNIETLNSEYALNSLQITFDNLTDKQKFETTYNLISNSDDLTITLSNYDLQAVYTNLNQIQVYPLKIEVLKPSLESVFMEVTNV